MIALNFWRRMAQIFVSYSRDDHLAADRLAKDLRDLGHAVWLDQDLSGGQAWWEQILAQIRGADVFVFVLSAASLASTACQREYGYAAELRRPILPVLVGEGLSLNRLPPALSQVQLVDGREPTVQAIKALVRALQSLPPAVPLPDPLPPPPEVPLSYLTNLSQQLDSPATLSVEEQSRLFLDLKTGLRDPATAQDARDLLGRLRVRRDLLATVAVEIDEALARAPKRQRKASQGNARSAYAPPRREHPFGIASPSWIRWLVARLRQSDRAIKSWSISELWWPSDESTRRRLAQQKIVVHWLLWSVPYLSLVSGVLSVILLRNPLPIFGAIALCFGLHIIVVFVVAVLNMHWEYQWGDTWLLMLLICWGVIGGFITQVTIQRAHRRLAAHD
jgi:hypothetical protein